MAAYCPGVPWRRPGAGGITPSRAEALGGQGPGIPEDSPSLREGSWEADVDRMKQQILPGESRTACLKDMLLSTSSLAFVLAWMRLNFKNSPTVQPFPTTSATAGVVPAPGVCLGPPPLRPVRRLQPPFTWSEQRHLASSHTQLRDGSSPAADLLAASIALERHAKAPGLRTPCTPGASPTLPALAPLGRPGLFG